VEDDLDLSRLNRIHGYLWMAGRPFNARPLQRLQMIGYDITPTDRADLHLLRMSKKLLVKPLPDYLLDYGFWMQYICPTAKLHADACGFLLSYIWLICSPLDLKMAQDANLIRSDLEWRSWKTLVKEFTEAIDVNTLHQVNKRYHFGELRLGRINTIYRIRFMFTNFVRGYLWEYNRYVVFVERNFSWLLALFAYFSIILSAMQVGSAIPPLQESRRFAQASYGFVVFSIIIVLVLWVFIGVIFVWTFFFNMGESIGHTRRARLEREKQAREYEEKNAA
jgi:hypothetical protein